MGGPTYLSRTVSDSTPTWVFGALLWRAWSVSTNREYGISGDGTKKTTRSACDCINPPTIAGRSSFGTGSELTSAVPSFSSSTKTQRPSQVSSFPGDLSLRRGIRTPTECRRGIAKTHTSRMRKTLASGRASNVRNRSRPIALWTPYGL